MSLILTWFRGSFLVSYLHKTKLRGGFSVYFQIFLPFNFLNVRVEEITFILCRCWELESKTPNLRFVSLSPWIDSLPYSYRCSEISKDHPIPQEVFPTGSLTDYLHSPGPWHPSRAFGGTQVKVQHLVNRSDGLWIVCYTGILSLLQGGRPTSSSWSPPTQISSLRYGRPFVKSRFLLRCRVPP